MELQRVEHDLVTKQQQTERNGEKAGHLASFMFCYGKHNLPSHGKNCKHPNQYYKLTETHRCSESVKTWVERGI